MARLRARSRRPLGARGGPGQVRGKWGREESGRLVFMRDKFRFVASKSDCSNFEGFGEKAND